MIVVGEGRMPPPVHMVDEIDVHADSRRSGHHAAVTTDKVLAKTPLQISGDADVGDPGSGTLSAVHRVHGRKGGLVRPGRDASSQATQFYGNNIMPGQGCVRRRSPFVDRGGDGDPTATLAARSIAKNGQLVEITSRSDHEPGFASKTPSATFTIQTADGEVLANGTAIEVDGRWWVDHITMCDPSDLNIG